MTTSERAEVVQRVSQPVVGVLDWGIGGIGVQRLLCRRYPGARFVYLADSGSGPYGKQAPAALLGRLCSVVDALRRLDVGSIVVACNAASTALAELEMEFPAVEFVGMLEAGVDTIRSHPYHRVLIIGGERTIRSGYFQTVFEGDARYSLQYLVAQPLSALIEAGRQDSAEFHSELAKLKRALHEEVEAILLACTHYPAAASRFAHVFPSVVLLDPAEQVASDPRLRKRLGLASNDARGDVTFFTTGAIRASSEAARRAYGVDAEFMPFQVHTQ